MQLIIHDDRRGEFYSRITFVRVVSCLGSEDYVFFYFGIYCRELVTERQLFLWRCIW